MIRVLNFFCVAVMGLSILALYHVSERTRTAGMALARVERQIAADKAETSALQTEWEHLASPARIQHLAETRLGLTDTATVQLSALTLLPRRGEAPLGGTQLRAASAQMPEAPPRFQQVAVRSGM